MGTRDVVGDPIVLTVNFTVAGILTDPTTISLAVTDPAGTLNTYTFAGGTVTKTSTGIYTKTVTASSAGVWSYTWTGTGTATDVQNGTFTIYGLYPLPVYCTLDELKAEKGIGDTLEDDVLSRAINAASRQIDGAAGWRFWQDGSVVARTFYASDGPMCLNLLDCGEGGADGISTTSGLIVKVDPGDIGSYTTTLTLNTDFILAPLNAAARVPAWPYTEIRLVGQPTFYFMRSSYFRPLIQVTAKWGWAAVPDDIAKACLIQAGQLAKAKDASLGFVELGDSGFASPIRAPMHAMARSLIAPYCRPSVG